MVAYGQAKSLDSGPWTLDSPLMSPDEALQRLKDGNHRFRKGKAEAERWEDLSAGQSPFAVVLGCADSRVPVEKIFDQRAGDLFTVRVAGNVAGKSQVESIDFALGNFSPAPALVVVLGHSGCGAVGATLRLMTGKEAPAYPLPSVVRRVRLALSGLDLSGDFDALAAEGVRENVRAAVRRLRKKSRLLREAEEQSALKLAGAEYLLEKGKVRFLEVP